MPHSDFDVLENVPAITSYTIQANNNNNNNNMLAYKAPVCQKTSEAPEIINSTLHNTAVTVNSKSVHPELNTGIQSF